LGRVPILYASSVEENHCGLAHEDGECQFLKNIIFQSLNQYPA
jgi:hypothetical protein